MPVRNRLREEPRALDCEGIWLQLNRSTELIFCCVLRQKLWIASSSGWFRKETEALEGSFVLWLPTQHLFEFMLSFVEHPKHRIR